MAAELSRIYPQTAMPLAGIMIEIYAVSTWDIRKNVTLYTQRSWPRIFGRLLNFLTRQLDHDHQGHRDILLPARDCACESLLRGLSSNSNFTGTTAGDEDRPRVVHDARLAGRIC